MEITKDQREALDTITYAHDKMDRAIADIYSFSNSGDIGWNQGAELGALASEIRDQWTKIEKALEKLHVLREDD
jgi:hypothetical protein